MPTTKMNPNAKCFSVMTLAKAEEVSSSNPWKMNEERYTLDVARSIMGASTAAAARLVHRTTPRNIQDGDTIVLDHHIAKDLATVSYVNAIDAAEPYYRIGYRFTDDIDGSERSSYTHRRPTDIVYKLVR